MGKNPRILSLSLPVLFLKTKRIVISTEAAHSFIVNGEAEKSASPPYRSKSQDHALAVAFILCSCNSNPQTIEPIDQHQVTVGMSVMHKPLYWI
jgi:hypothetical protein